MKKILIAVSVFLAVISSCSQDMGYLNDYDVIPLECTVFNHNPRCVACGPFFCQTVLERAGKFLNGMPARYARFGIADTITPDMVYVEGSPITSDTLVFSFSLNIPYPLNSRDSAAIRNWLCSPFGQGVIYDMYDDVFKTLWYGQSQYARFQNGPLYFVTRFAISYSDRPTAINYDYFGRAQSGNPFAAHPVF